MRCVPDGEDSEEDGRTDPESFVVLRSPGVLAFLDIMPMTRGKCLGKRLDIWGGRVIGAV